MISHNMAYPVAAARAYAAHIVGNDDPAGADPYGARRSGGGAPYRPPSTVPPQADPTPSSPPGFHRAPNVTHAYTYFEAFLILDDLDGFYRETPHMPAALVSHDCLHEDWIRFMQVRSTANPNALETDTCGSLLQDLAFAWSGRIPAPELGRNGRPPHPGTIVADLVDVWNARFFRMRGVELIVYRGRMPVSGRGRGVAPGVPGDDEQDEDYVRKPYSLCLRCLPQSPNGPGA